LTSKLPIALALGAILVLPVLAQTLNSRTAQAANTHGAQTSDGALLLVAPGSQTTATGALPTRGMTMAQVETSHGSPSLRKAPVGDPPITRWEYSDFIVYFEYRHVIHSVAKLQQ